MTGSDRFDKLIRLLELEAEAERLQLTERLQAAGTGPRAQEATGLTLADLAIVEESGGLGGRWVCKFAKPSGDPLPWTRLDSGSPVFLTHRQWEQNVSLRGVVVAKIAAEIRVAFDEPPPSGDEAAHRGYRLDLAHDEISRRREREAVTEVRDADKGRLAELRNVVVGDKAPEFRREDELTFLNGDLNESQKEAVAFALRAEDFAVVHGPPGTGKTTTLVEIARQALGRGERVLVSAPSNLGVDNVLQKLAEAGVDVVRLGHPARVHPELLESTLDFKVNATEERKLAQELWRQASELFHQLSRWTRTPPPPGRRREMRAEAKGLMADARKQEQRAIERCLDRAQVIGATATGVNRRVLGERRFDTVIIDEAAQATEPNAWIPLLRAEKAVLAGDHCQLPPTILSQKAQDEGLGQSLLEHLVGLYENALTVRLEVQYRMHESIMAFSSERFYEGTLQAHGSVAAHLLKDVEGVEAGELTCTALHFFDTAGADFGEEIEEDGESRLNRKEATFVLHTTKKLLEAGVSGEAVAVIAPYAAQVRHLREQFFEDGLGGVEIDTVDGFQGREKEAVVVSLVRSNEKGEVGFLKELRRMNVALTRARRCLVVIGDSATLGGHPFYEKLLSHFESHGAYRSVWEEDPEVLAALGLY